MPGSSDQQRYLSGKEKQRIQKAVKQRLKTRPGNRLRDLEQAIRQEIAGVPWGLSKYQLFVWYLKQVPTGGGPRARARTRATRAAIPAVETDDFLRSYVWRKLRMEVLVARGARCECCGATRRDGVMIHVDHIKPRVRYPELALAIENLQVLCEVCNHGKGNWDETDWRGDAVSVVLTPTPTRELRGPRLVGGRDG